MMNPYRRLFLALVLLLLPWQTQWIVHELSLFHEVSQYGRLSLTIVDVAVVGYLLMSVGSWSAARLRARAQTWQGRLVLGGLGVACLWSLSSLLWALNPLAGVATAVRLCLGSLLALQLWLDEEVTVDRLLLGTALGLLLPSVLGWVQVWQQMIPASTLLGIAAQDPHTPGVAVVGLANGVRWLRAYGTFPHPNMLGGFVAMGWIGTWIVASRGRHSEWLVWLSSSVLGGALLLSASRAAWLAALVGGGLLWLWIRRAYPVARTALQSTILFSLTIMLMVGITIAPVIKTRVLAQAPLEQQSLTVRASQWQEAGALASQGMVQTMRGWGVGQTVPALARLNPLQPAWVYQPAHAVPVLVGLELGLVGLLCLLAVCLGLCWRSRAQWQTLAGVRVLALLSAAAILLVSDHYVWTLPSGLYAAAILMVVCLKELPPATV